METAPHGVESDLPTRLDRLPFGRWHTRIVVSLGITWVLDGLEVTIVGALGSALERPDALGLTSAQVGLAGTSYLAGAITGALVFGHLSDRLGRKQLFLVTLALYVAAAIGTACAWSFASFAIFRALTGAAIGGEYAAINSAIDELLPARVRGAADLGINGSYWLGTLAGALLTAYLLDPRHVPVAIGWRLAFGLGALLAVAIVLVRKNVPESPRWLLLEGRAAEAEAIVAAAESEARAAGHALAGDAPKVYVSLPRERGLRGALRVVVLRYPRRAVLGLVLMLAQAFFYNAIFFSYALLLTRFFGVAPERVGHYLVPFAIGNFLGPLVLGRLFDRVGRKTMIVATYAISGVLLVATGLAFRAGMFTATTQTAAWCVVFFFGSAAASSAYLTVSELFPVEHRAMAIALFYAAGTLAGGLGAPALFGWLIARGDPAEVFHGYALGGALMLVAAVVAYFLAVPAEGKSLEALAG